MVQHVKFMNPSAILLLIKAYPTIPLSGQSNLLRLYTVKKVSDFPFPAGMPLTKLYLVENNLIIPARWGRENH